tara:strand:+ start:14354 stop:14632 length:279 start_codon:yes stop_codon:yes gene_type:complete
VIINKSKTIKLNTMANKITKEELKLVNEQQAEYAGILNSLGMLALEKSRIVKLGEELLLKINDNKNSLEEKYGQVNIDLKDGSYVEIKKEEE